MILMAIGAAVGYLVDNSGKAVCVGALAGLGVGLIAVAIEADRRNARRDWAARVEARNQEILRKRMGSVGDDINSLLNQISKIPTTGG